MKKKGLKRFFWVAYWLVYFLTCYYCILDIGEGNIVFHKIGKISTVSYKIGDVNIIVYILWGIIHLFLCNYMVTPILKKVNYKKIYGVSFLVCLFSLAVRCVSASIGNNHLLGTNVFVIKCLLALVFLPLAWTLACFITHRISEYAAEAGRREKY